MTDIPHEGRVYYDHENVYRRLRAEGCTGWDQHGESEKLKAVARFLESKHAPSPGKALDLGCGGGEVAVFLAQRGWQVVGVDFSETAIQMAVKNAEGLNLPVEFIVVDITQRLPVDMGDFSLVIDCNALHCLIGSTDRMAFLRNASSALKEGGVMFSTGMTAEGYLNFEAANGIDPVTRIDTYHTRYWATLREILQEFEDAGLGVRYVSLQQQPLEDECGATAVIYAVRDGAM